MDMERRKVLLVDDEVKWLTTLRGFFEVRGYLVWIATNGEAALQIINQHHPHVVLLDMCLGDSRLQGFDVLREIKTKWTSTMVFMCSGSGNDGARAQALSLGAERFFDKPLNLAELLKAIQETNGHPSQP